MPDYSVEDLAVINPRETIRQRADWYAGGTPHGLHMALGMVRDLLVRYQLPVRIDHADGWWVITSAKDWLTPDDNGDAFSDVMPLPEGGAFAIRTEVVIASLSRAVVSAGAGGVRWIIGDPASDPLPASVNDDLANDGHGRVLAFKTNE